MIRPTTNSTTTTFTTPWQVVWDIYGIYPRNIHPKVKPRSRAMRMPHWQQWIHRCRRPGNSPTRLSGLIWKVDSINQPTLLTKRNVPWYRIYNVKYYRRIRYYWPPISIEREKPWRGTWPMCCVWHPPLPPPPLWLLPTYHQIPTMARNERHHGHGMSEWRPIIGYAFPKSPNKRYWRQCNVRFVNRTSRCTRKRTMHRSHTQQW